MSLSSPLPSCGSLCQVAFIITKKSLPCFGFLVFDPLFYPPTLELGLLCCVLFFLSASDITLHDTGCTVCLQSPGCGLCIFNFGWGERNPHPCSLSENREAMCYFCPVLNSHWISVTFHSLEHLFSFEWRSKLPLETFHSERLLFFLKNEISLQYELATQKNLVQSNETAGDSQKASSAHWYILCLASNNIFITYIKMLVGDWIVYRLEYTALRSAHRKLTHCERKYILILISSSLSYAKKSFNV